MFEMNEIENTIIKGDVSESLLEFPTESIDMIVTSPPYWGLRDYGVPGQIGLEDTFEKYLEVITSVFMECHRILKSTGTLWLNIGDSYSHNGAAYGSEKSTFTGRKQGEEMGKAKRFKKECCKPKDLIGQPWEIAFALRKAGWYLRQDIIWSKPNPMPESVTDRCTKAHEYIFLMSKSRNYYYDAESIRENCRYKVGTGVGFGHGYDKNKKQRVKVPDGWDTGKGSHGNIHKSGRNRGHVKEHQGFNEKWDKMTKQEQSRNGRNKRSVWNVATESFPDAHFATFPQKLIEPCILAGCPEGGIVLDPFMGAGTTGCVAKKLNRRYSGIELNPDYILIANNRIDKVNPGLPGMN